MILKNEQFLQFNQFRLPYCNQLSSEQMKTQGFERETPLHRRKQDFYGFESITGFS